MKSGIFSFSAALLEEIDHFLRGEEPEQVIFERKVETASARVTLATAPASELTVDTA